MSTIAERIEGLANRTGPRVIPRSVHSLWTTCATCRAATPADDLAGGLVCASCHDDTRAVCYELAGRPMPYAEPPTAGAVGGSCGVAVARGPGVAEHTIARIPATASTPSAAGTLRREPRRFRPRPTEWAPVRADLYAQLDELGPRVERVYLIGGRPGGGTADGLRTWATGPVPPGWSADPTPYMEGELPALRYRRTDGAGVELIRAAAWYGDTTATPETAAAAYALLGQLVGDAFDDGELLTTPASTGRFLLMRSLGTRTFPVLDDETQELIRSTSGQGRIELLPAAAANVAQLVEYDGRLMYAGCVRELGHGVPTHDYGDDFAGFQRGRYRVRFTVPADWSHVGLLGVYDGDVWRYPSEPGSQWETWADAVEVRMALDQGWTLTICERLLFPEWRGRPLDSWADKLVAIRGRLLSRAAVGTDDPAVCALAAAGVRAILLHGIGALHGRRHAVTRSSTNAADVPADAGDTWRMEAGVHVWSEAERQAWPAMAHPEWSAAIWARARARLLLAPAGRGHEPAGALSVPASTVVAFRTDAVYLTADPGWHDDGAVGRLRRHGVTPGPIPWPATVAELLTARRATP